MRVFKKGIVPVILIRCNECRSLLFVNRNDIDMGDYKYPVSWPYVGGYDYSYNCPVCKRKNHVREELVEKLEKKQTKVRVRTRFR